jgi:hypothetical protein
MKKGDVTNQYGTAANYNVVVTCIGFIIALKYGLQPNETEVTLDAKGKWTTPYTSAKCYDTLEKAELKAKSIQKDHVQELYCRTYFSSKYSKL